MLSLVCRVAIMGRVPMFAIRANTRGSGKGLLADVISLIGTDAPRRIGPRSPTTKKTANGLSIPRPGIPWSILIM